MIYNGKTAREKTSGSAVSTKHDKDIYLNEANFVTWQEAFGSHARKELGKAAGFLIKKGERFVEPMHTGEDIDRRVAQAEGAVAMTPAVLAGAIKDATVHLNKERDAINKKNKEAEPDLFDLIRSHVSASALAKINADARYAQAREDDDPVLLYTIIRIKFGGLPDGDLPPDPLVVLQHQATGSTFAQGPRENLTDYNDRWLAHHKHGLILKLTPPD